MEVIEKGGHGDYARNPCHERSFGIPAANGQLGHSARATSRKDLRVSKRQRL